jgi:hypothetical protein
MDAGVSPMQAINATISVDENGHATILERIFTAPGKHSAVIVIEQKPVEKKPLILPKIKGELRNPNDTFRREDMYDDDGR